MNLHKTIIDNEGFIIEVCVLFINNNPQGFEITEDMKIVDRYTLGNELIKPKWDSDSKKWIEGATDEEIKEWEEHNKPLSKESSETEILQKQLLETQALVAELRYKTILKENGGI
ncbi:hypothetical protein U728_1240 [Clostridium botulinum 202F]|nr:hypothetical protein U728_1240 [Clostridium botulinum 202F]KAI3346987.1 hypothetical protein CIT17_08435 [Clostridium botulinum]KON13676.1 hypothetical protein ACP50_06330 [Clostridium botulinum]MBY6987222.1 hypothetical protein [Clostridium botulinum]NFG99662.1 hypothetical protein [Clostridium botulinum]